MNSSWKGDLIIFAMVMVPIHSDGQIKIRVSSALNNQPLIKLGQSLQKSPSGSGFM